MSSTMYYVDRPAARAGSTTTIATPANLAGACVLPRCTFKFEKCAGGFKLNCSCDDEVACGALQNLCNQLAGQQCSICCQWNGTTVCECNLCCGHVKCELTKDGCCFTCTSGDKACCEMCQACCDCLCKCCDCGCLCCVSLGGTPICCGCC